MAEGAACDVKDPRRAFLHGPGQRLAEAHVRLQIEVRKAQDQQTPPAFEPRRDIDQRHHGAVVEHDRVLGTSLKPDRDPIPCRPIDDQPSQLAVCRHVETHLRRPEVSERPPVAATDGYAHLATRQECVGRHHHDGIRVQPGGSLPQAAHGLHRGIDLGHLGPAYLGYDDRGMRSEKTADKGHVHTSDESVAPATFSPQYRQRPPSR